MNPEVTRNFADFEEQFGRRETLNFPEGKIDVVSIEPEFVTDPTPILIGVGWSENPDTYKKSLKVLADYGRSAFALGYHRRGGKVWPDESYPVAEVRKSIQILQLLDHKDLDQVDAIFHSEGAINGLIAAMMFPESFRNIVLDKPSGFIGKDGKASLSGRFLKLMIQEAFQRKPGSLLTPAFREDGIANKSKKLVELLISSAKNGELFSMSDPTNGVSALLRTSGYAIGNPKRMWDELDALTTEDITTLIRHLNNEGVMISIVGGVDDPLYPVKRQMKHMRNLQEESGEKLPIEGYVSVKGGHNEISINADMHTLLASELLKGMQRRRDKQSNLGE